MHDDPDLIPLSQFALDYAPPTTGWEADLARRGITVKRDALGRKAITTAAAKELIVEQEASAARAREEAQRH